MARGSHALERVAAYNAAMQTNRGTAWALTALGLVLPTLVTYVYFTALADASPSTQQAAFSIGKTAQFGLPILMVLWLGRWSRPGVRRTGLSLLWGLISGVAIAVAIYAAYRWLLAPLGVTDSVAVEVREKLQETGIESPALFVMVGCGYAVLHSGLEEYYWRWFIYGSLRNLAGVPTALAVSSLGFMAHHVLVLARYFGWASPWTYVASLCVAFGGLVWAYLYERTGSLTGTWLSHAFVDAAIFIVGYKLAFA